MILAEDAAEAANLDPLVETVLTKVILQTLEFAFETLIVFVCK